MIAIRGKGKEVVSIPEVLTRSCVAGGVSHQDGEVRRGGLMRGNAESIFGTSRRDETGWRRCLEGSSWQRLGLKIQIWETPVRP